MCRSQQTGQPTPTTGSVPIQLELKGCLRYVFQKFPALRRASIYMVLSYVALTLVNNSPLELDNMWLVYLPMFITIYMFSRWLDSRFNQS